jgi:transposase
MDLHKRYATISVRDENGKEIRLLKKCTDFNAYISKLTSEDVVVIEALNNAFFWADKIEQQGATCQIVDPHKFKIICDSWSKTDKKDSAKLSLALWMAITRNEFKLPTVYKPNSTVRELRRLFTQYDMMNRQVRQYKNVIQAHLTENGIALSSAIKERLLNPKRGLEVFETLDTITHSTRVCIIMNLYLLWNLLDQKEILKREIIKAGIPFESQMKLLITIKGVTPFLALAFLADVGDITRFTSARKFNSYLGVVPTVKSSGGKTHLGSINKQSRHLSRSLFTQIVPHFITSASHLNEFFETTKARRGVARTRIAILRKLFTIMRSILLNNEEYRWKDDINYHNKLCDYTLELRRIQIMAESA